MANTKIYTIQINGLTESVKAVDALSDSLQFLDKKIKEMESRSVNISSTSSGSNYKSLQSEDTLLKQIQKTEQEIVNARREEYNQLLADKDLLKQTKDLAEQRAASERLAASNYANTMQGMKQELADIKKVMNTTNIDSDNFKQMTARAGELTNKLKELEQSYGQFSRNVGNYPKQMADGFNGIKIAVAGTVHEFDNAKQALKTLQGELRTLQVKKDQGMLLSDEELKRFEELPSVVAQLKSSIQDAGKPMDNLMDSMQSVVAIMQSTKGISAFFGIDNDEIEKSIQKLVGLQNAANGIQTAFKQWQSGEGLFGAFKKGDQYIKNFTNNLFGVNRAAKTTTTTTQAMNTTITATGTAGKTAATGLGTATVAANTTTVAFKAATVAATALRAVLSALGIGLVIGAISLLVDGISSLIDKQKEAKKEQEELNNALHQSKEEYGKAEAEVKILQTKLEKFNGTKKQEKKLVEELNSKNKDSFGQYKTLAEWKKILSEKSKVYCEILFKEAEAQALVNQYAANFVEISKAIAEGDTEKVARLKSWNKILLYRAQQIYGEIDNLSQKNGLFDYAPQIEENSKKTEKSLKKALENINKLEIELMEDGEKKVLAQLKKEREDRIKEAIKTGYKVNEQKELINKLYDKKEIEARKEQYAKLLSLRQQFDNAMQSAQESNNAMASSNSKLANSNRLEEGLASAYKDVLSGGKIKDFLFDYNKSIFPPFFKTFKNDFATTKNLTIKGIEDIRKVYEDTKKFVEESDASLKRTKEKIEGLEFKRDEKTNFVEAIFPDNLSDEIKEKVNVIVEAFNKGVEQQSGIEKVWGQLLDNSLNGQIKSLEKSFEDRYSARQKYYEKVLELSKTFYDKEKELLDEEIGKEEQKLKEAEDKRYNSQVSKTKDKTPIGNALKSYNESITNGELIGLDTSQIESYFSKYKEYVDKWLAEQDEALKKGEISIQEYTDNTGGKLLESYRKNEISFVEYLDYLRQEDETHQNAINSIEKQAEEKRTQNTLNYQNNIKEKTIAYYDSLRQEVSTFATHISNIRDKAEVKNAWGVINYGKTRASLKSLQDDIKASFDKIATQKQELKQKLDNNEIEFVDYDSAINELNALENELKVGAEGVQQDLKDLGGKWWGSIDQWIQSVGSAVSDILGSISEITSNHYEEQITQQEKYIDKYEELLDKQRDITQKYADDINSIEDELKTARGDRRQQLIDQLNAEMAAQRESLAQEKKIEKEKEKAEQKKKKLEHDQAVAEKKMSLWQAAINAAMAVSMAAVNHWPIPAIPMMSMAAAVGAAQIAAVASKPIPTYATGGVIEGKSHSQGGVKVLGGQAEVEGREFITNKVTTQENVDLMYYINSKKRKLNIDDFIEFYSGNNVRKNIQSVKTRFADGGQIPVLSNSIDINDRMITAMEDYSNRPVVVSVVDIIDRTQRVNDVKVMAGLND